MLQTDEALIHSNLGAAIITLPSSLDKKLNNTIQLIVGTILCCVKISIDRYYEVVNFGRNNVMYSLVTTHITIKNIRIDDSPDNNNNK